VPALGTEASPVLTLFLMEEGRFFFLSFDSVTR